MNKLNVENNKTLILKKIIIEKHNNIKVQEVDKKVQEFENKLQILNVQKFGPLITKMSGTQISEDGELTVNYELIVQANDYKQYNKQFEIIDELLIKNCIYVRFDDKPQYMELATSAIELYMYEHDIVDSGILYTVILNGSDDHIKIDYFKPEI